MPQSSKKAVQETSGRSRRPKSTDSHWVGVLLADFASRRKYYLDLIASNGKDELNVHLKGILVCSEHPLPAAPGGSLIDWAFRILGRLSDESLQLALAQRKALKSLRRKHLRLFARNVFIYKYPERFAVLLGFAHIGVDRLTEEYPPRNHWVASSPEIYNLWLSYLENYDQPDPRLKRHELLLLDRNKLNLSIPEGLSCCLYDKETNDLVFVVIRQFANHRSIIEWASKIVRDAAVNRKSIRLEDPGSLLQVAFSAGSRSAPAFGMVRNFRVSSPQSERDAENHQIASLFAYVWVRAKGLFPPAIIKDFEDFYDKYDIPRFDPDWPSSQTRCGSVELPSDLGSIRFEDVERGPGLGVLHDRYARAVHMENQGHKWAISWMSNRFGKNPDGGHFYLCAYGVESTAAGDTSWAWCPCLWHCTGLSNYEPTFDIPEVPDENHNQQGVAFVSSARVPKVYLKWAAKNVPGREKVKGALDDLGKPHDPLSDPPEDVYA